MVPGFFTQLKETVDSYRRCDPATNSALEVLLLYPGIRVWVFHYFAHRLYARKVPFIPRLLSEIGRFLSGIDIHPGAKIGRRVIMDHGLGIVIGETAEVGDDVLIYQNVTLGGTSLERKKRHPTIASGTVIGAGAKVLGNIFVGENCRVGANSVVVKSVPPGATVVGIPGRIVSSEGVKKGQELEHGQLPDPLQERLLRLEDRLAKLEGEAERKD